MRQTKRLHDVWYDSIVEFDRVQTALRNERMQCLEDRRFYSIAGAQWEGPLGDQFENKPKFEVNKIHLAVIRIINEYRNNRISANFLPKNGVKKQALSDCCNGLYRADMEDSCADEAKDNGFEEAVGGGIGGYRLRCDYEDEDDPENEYQRIKCEPIYDADSSIWFDLDAKKQDKSDARRCWVISSMTRTAYKKKYGDDPSSWPKTVYRSEFDWLTPDVVYVAQYYVLEEVKDEVVTFTGLDDQEVKHREVELEADPELVKRLLVTGFQETSRKKVTRTKCHKYILSGNGILKDEGFIAGTCIPIVPVYGKRWFVDNVERCMGHVRLAKDTQRLTNMQMSKLGELAAFSAREKPILTAEEAAGHAVMWSEDATKDYPYLLVNQILDATGSPMVRPMQYTKVPNVPPALAAIMQISAQDFSDLLGNQEAGEEMQTGMSGIAVELIQNKLDMQTFIYMSNMGKAEKRCAEIWLSMAQDVYVEEGRIMKTVDSQGEIGSVELMKPMINEQSGAYEYDNDLADARMDVIVAIGPSSASRRAAVVRALTGMMQITEDPEIKQVLSSMAMLNMEGEGIQEVRDFFRQKLIKMGVIKPTDEEAQELQQAVEAAPPDPNAVFLQASAQKESALAGKAQADTVLSQAKTEESKANAIKLLADAQEVGHDSFRKSVDALGNAFQDDRAGLQPA